MRCAPRSPHRASALVLLVTTLITLVTTVALVPPAAAATAAPAVATNAVLTTAYQHRDGSVSVAGYAWDGARRSSPTAVCLAVAGRCLRVVRADLPSPTFDAERALHGGHRFAATIRAQRAGAVLAVTSRGAHAKVLDRAAISTPGARVVAVARKYVGHARYVEGGATPQQGFDCSGYTLFSYRVGGVGSLPHNANSQRYVAHMRRITRAQARPGDLVFYLSGGSAFHVAIYAGHGMQYAAATPRDGIRYQAIWSSAVEFRTNWH